MAAEEEKARAEAEEPARAEVARAVAGWEEEMAAEVEVPFGPKVMISRRSRHTRQGRRRRGRRGWRRRRERAEAAARLEASGGPSTGGPDYFRDRAWYGGANSEPSDLESKLNTKDGGAPKTTQLNLAQTISIQKIYTIIYYVNMQIKYLLNSEIYDPKLNKSCYQSSKRLDILNNLLKEKNIQIPLSILGFDKAEQHRSPTLVATPTPTRKATNADGTTPSSAAERVAKAEEAGSGARKREKKICCVKLIAIKI